MSLLPALCWASLVAGAVPVGTELQYSGTLSQSASNGDKAVKTFSVAGMVLPGDAQPAFVFQIEERGGGGWPWPERFGRLELGAAPAGRGVRLLHTFDGHPYVVAVRSPFFEFNDRLQANAEWADGRNQYACVRTKKFKERDCWLVECSLDRARRQTLHIEQGSGLLVGLEERLFLGRGDEFRLKLELESTRTLTAAELEKAAAPATALLSLQTALARPDDARQPELTPAQLQATADAIEALKQQAAGTAWARLVDTIARDLQQQQRRLEGVAGLERKFVGQSLPFRGAKLLAGGTLSADATANRVTVLHFWDYNGDKLVEPYGQVGYLDFLSNRRTKLGAQIIGVAVDARLGDPAQAGAAQRTVRKLQEFMNLGYPVALDDGTLLKQYGDPRALGSQLPLWVVIGHDGKITHYKVGHYDIQPDEGLKELDAAVVDGLKKQKAAERGQ